MKIAFTGDVFLGREISDDFAINITEFNEADCRVVNLEHPISSSDHYEDKCTLYADPRSVEVLLKSNINCAVLANNHIQDKGRVGLLDTFRHLGEKNITYVGAGIDSISANIPAKLDDKLQLKAYCEKNNSYLKEVKVATSSDWGVPIIDYQTTIEEIRMISDSVVVYLHWGREHTGLPPRDDIDFMRRLLALDNVITVIGSHAHLIQGEVRCRGKKGYMCLGNFVFPSFYIKSPVQLYFPTNTQKEAVKFETNQYLEVFEPTKKIWKRRNRVSLIVVYDSVTCKLSENFVKQDRNDQSVSDLKGIELIYEFLRYKILSAVYVLPSPIYSCLYSINTFFIVNLWRYKNIFFQCRQLGFFKLLKLKWKRRYG